MNWLDYRQKLQIGFDDQKKIKYFITKIFNLLENCVENYWVQIDGEEYFKFCNISGITMTQGLLPDEYYSEIMKVLHNHSQSLADFLSFYIAFINCQTDEEFKPLKKEECKNILCHMLDESQIPYEVIQDKDGYYVFPQGAKELDDALVSELLLWLQDYPATQKAYITALKQYSDGIYIRDVADNLRKALETFLQEFLRNEKNLETNKNEICKYLGREEVDPGICGLFQPLINAYKNINDRIAKHNDKVDARLLEFILYQTGILIRMVLSIEFSKDN